MSVLFQAQKNLSASKNSLLSKDTETLSLEDISKLPEFEAKLARAMNEKRIDEVVCSWVAAEITGQNVIFQVTGFHDTVDTKEEFEYTMKGKDYKAIRRAIWVKSSNTTAMFNIPLPLALGKELKVGDSLTLSVHPVAKGTNVYQANKEFFAEDVANAKITRVPYGQNTYLPAHGCGFAAFETSVKDLAAQQTAQFTALKELVAVEV